MSRAGFHKEMSLEFYNQAVTEEEYESLPGRATSSMSSPLCPRLHTATTHHVFPLLQNTKHYELLNYSEHGTTVDNVLYSCDFSEKTPPTPPSSIVAKVQSVISKLEQRPVTTQLRPQSPWLCHAVNDLQFFAFPVPLAKLIVGGPGKGHQESSAEHPHIYQTFLGT